MKKKLDGTHKEKEIEEIPFISKFKMKFIKCGGNEKKNWMELIRKRKLKKFRLSQNLK